MNTAPASPDEPALAEAMAPLRAIPAASRVTAPPRRLPMADGRECLVQWQPDSEGGDWSLVLHARSPDATDIETPLARLALHLREGAKPPSIYWEGADEAFRGWVAENLPAIARDVAARQAAELEAVRLRAGITANLARKLGELLPHVVVLGGLAVFAYMFGIVHIN